MPEIQLDAVTKFGPSALTVDYSDDVMSLIINTQRESVARPPTYGKPFRSTRAGAAQYTATVRFVSDITAASVWAEFMDAIDTATAEIDFEAQYEIAAVSADNPLYTGTLIVLEANIGHDAGAFREHTITLPLKEKYTKSITPV